jgi:hypothetical protein
MLSFMKVEEVESNVAGWLFDVELFTDADAFEVNFPEDASADQKGILIGTSVLLNAVFYGGGE